MGDAWYCPRHFCCVVGQAFWAPRLDSSSLAPSHLPASLPLNLLISTFLSTFAGHLPPSPPPHQSALVCTSPASATQHLRACLCACALVFNPTNLFLSLPPSFVPSLAICISISLCLSRSLPRVVIVIVAVDIVVVVVIGIVRRPTSRMPCSSSRARESYP